jgi:hypothetical protein
MKKNFDCVEMKNSIQKKMLEEENRVGTEEMRRRRKEWLRNSDDELAKLWRRLAARQKATEIVPASAVMEESMEFGSRE